jgi:hypothetical protein
MRKAFLLVGLLVVLSIASCRAPVRPYLCVIDPQIEAGQVDVDAQWRCNRDVLYRAARLKAFSLREFHQAAAFFEQLIGLQVDTRSSHLGTLPGPGLRQDVRDLDAWYELNKEKLRWDAGLGKILYEGLAPAAAGG